MSNYYDIDREIERLQKIKHERKAADDEVNKFNKLYSNLHPRMQFYMCNKIRVFEYLVKTHGNEYHPNQIYERLLYDNCNTDEEFHERLIFCCQLLVGGYFDDTIFVKNQYDRCHRIMYGNELLRELLICNDFERIKMVIDYLCYTFAKKGNLKLIINTYKNLSSYESNAIERITKDVSESKVDDFYNNHYSLYVMYEILMGELLSYVKITTSSNILNYILVQFTKPNPQHNQSQKVLRLDINPSFNKIFMQSLENKDEKRIYLIRPFIDLTKGFDVKNIIKSLIATNDIDWLNKIVNLFNIDLNGYYCYMFYFDGENSIIDFKNITLNMYKRLFELIKPNHINTNSGCYKIIKHCYNIYRNDLAEYIIINLPYNYKN